MKAKYIGNLNFFKGGDYKVITIIHDNEPLGNGEVNRSGGNIYICERGKEPHWMFREDEVELIND